jgi:hypothetical protein
MVWQCWRETGRERAISGTVCGPSFTNNRKISPLAAGGREARRRLGDRLDAEIELDHGDREIENVFGARL